MNNSEVNHRPNDKVSGERKEKERERTGSRSGAIEIAATSDVNYRVRVLLHPYGRGRSYSAFIPVSFPLSLRLFLSAFATETFWIVNTFNVVGKTILNAPVARCD